MKNHALLLPVLAVLALTCSCGKSGYANCVEVAQESDFTGDMLKTEKAVMAARLKTADCVALDRAKDNSTGPMSGKVRWAECYAGPDCNEAGDF